MVILAGGLASSSRSYNLITFLIDFHDRHERFGDKEQTTSSWEQLLCGRTTAANDPADVNSFGDVALEST